MPVFEFAQIDAFADRPFMGNQACVIPMKTYLPDETLQAIAAENNVAETAFIVDLGNDRWELRWFTPAVEVPLCGHATLAAGHYLFSLDMVTGGKITFVTRKSGELFVSQLSDGRLEMDFPAPEITPVAPSDEIAAALGGWPIAAWGGPFYAAQFASVDDIFDMNPDLTALKRLGSPVKGWDRGNFGCFALGGDGVDVTSRFFAPGSGIDEDPATGSWHCMLTAIIARRFDRAIQCYQAFPSRGALLETELVGDRVKLRGNSVTVIKGSFTL